MLHVVHSRATYLCTLSCLLPSSMFVAHTCLGAIALRHPAFCPTWPVRVHPSSPALARCGLHCPHSPFRALSRAPCICCHASTRVPVLLYFSACPQARPYCCQWLSTRPQAKPWRPPSWFTTMTVGQCSSKIGWAKTEPKSMTSHWEILNPWPNRVYTNQAKPNEKFELVWSGLVGLGLALRTLRTNFFLKNNLRYFFGLFELIIIH